MNKVKLKFRVDPDYLKNNTIVEDAVRIRFIDPEKVFVLGLLGESGRTMMLNGAVFEFERKQAKWMIKQKIAVRADSLDEVWSHGVRQKCLCGIPLSSKHDGHEC